MNLIKSKPFLYTSLAFVVALIPLISDINRSTLTLWNMVVIYAIIAIGFNILLGYAGQISLGHAAFMGIGAYVSANLTGVLELPFLLSLLVGGLVPLFIGLFLGLIALRLEGHYLAIATLGLGVAIQQTFKEWNGFTNGFSGMRADNPVIFGIEIVEREHFFILAMIILLILVLFSHFLLKSKTGRALIAMRDSEHAAQTMGVSLFKYKLIAFAASTFYAGIAGVLYMHLVRFTEPNVWGITLSLNLLAMVVIGGLGTIGGSVIGAAFIVLLPEYIKDIEFLAGIKSFSTIFTGFAMIIVIMFFPHGIVRIGTQIKLALLKRKNSRLKNGEGGATNGDFEG